MSFAIADRVQETTTTTGTGTLTLAGAVTGYQAFSAGVGDGKQCHYAISDGAHWEVGQGTYTASGTTLSRDVVLASSNSGSAVSWSAGVKNVWLDFPAAQALSILGCLSPRGLALSWVSATKVTVAAGSTPDALAAAILALASASTINTATKDAALGVVRHQLAGTVATTSGSKSVTGSSTAFTTDFGSRAGTGTLTASASTTITGSGTAFLSQVAVNDLIGNASSGFARVTAIASDTSLSVSLALTFSAASFSVIEQPTIKCGSQAVNQVDKIASDTSLTLVNNASSTTSGQTAIAGDLLAVAAGTGALFLFAFVATGASGTTVLLSTQRTTPWLPTGYTWAFRRVGSVLLDSSGNIAAFSQWGAGAARRYRFEKDINASPFALVSATFATSWTAAVASGCVPPTAGVLYLTRLIFNATGGNFTDKLNLRPRGVGDSALTLRPGGQFAGINQYQSDGDWYPCDGAQAIEWNCTQSSDVCYIFVGGYEEVL